MGKIDPALAINASYATILDDDGKPVLGADGKSASALNSIIHPRFSVIKNALVDVKFHMPELDTEIINHIGKEQFKVIVDRARDAELSLGKNDEKFPPERQDVINGFSGIYHVLTAETPEGRNLRRAIEKMFEVLELGSIPPMQFAEKPAEQSKGGGRSA